MTNINSNSDSSAEHEVETGAAAPLHQAEIIHPPFAKPTAEQDGTAIGSKASGSGVKARKKQWAFVRDDATSDAAVVSSDQPSCVAAATLSPDRGALLAAALDAVKEYATADKEAAGTVDGHGREAVRRMLLVRESFEVDGEFDWPAFNRYADSARGRLKQPPKNPWQRLARVCCPSKVTKPPQVSKFGYVLAALDRRRIKAADVMAEFEKREPVKPGGSEHSGLERFVRLYKRDMKELAGETDPKNPYAGFSDGRIAKHAEFLIEELDRRGMLRDDIVDVENLLKDEALQNLE